MVHKLSSLVIHLFVLSSTFAFNQRFQFDHLRRNFKFRLNSELSYEDELVFSTEGYLAPKHWVLKVDNLRNNLDWFEKKFNFTVVCGL